MKHLYRIVCLAFLSLNSCSSGPTPVPILPPRPVHTVKVASLETLNKTYSGIVEAEQFSILAFKISGTLTELNVKTGQTIPQGYLIARINPTDYRLNYQTAETNYETAKAIYNRTRRLQEQNATALQNLEISQADFIQAGSAVNIARNTLDYTRLTAPFSGIIEQKYVENFQQVLTGQSIVKLINPGKLQVRFILPETAIQLISTPKRIYVRFDTQQEIWYETEVKEYIYSSDGTGIPVTLRITDPRFHPQTEEVYPGFSCQVLFKIENTIADKFIIPSSAIYYKDGLSFVWLVDKAGTSVHLHPVKAIRFEDKALIQEGLNSNDIIVTAGVSDLKEGQKVTFNNNL